MAEFDPFSLPAADSIAGATKRAAKRDSLFLLTALFDPTGAPLGKARVRNLSETGLMADCDAHFRDDDRLVVHLRGVGEVPGRITWVRGDRIGVAFDAAIDPRLARKPVKAGPADTMPHYLRPLPRVTRFSR